MKIIHLQNGMGPAGNAAYRLSCAMRKNGIDSAVLTLYPCSDYEHVYSHSNVRYPLFKKVVNTVINRIRLRGKLSDSYYYRVFSELGRNVIDNIHIQEADVIYVHWVAGALSMLDIKQIISLQKPVVFFMHDMWDFTGGCHHSFDCRQYETGCFDCPMFSENKKTPHKQIESLKSAFAEGNNFVFVSPSKWMASCARFSYAINSPVYAIPNVVDETIFRPINKREAKERLGLPLDKKIITFGCQAGTNNKYKGWSYLKEAMLKLSRHDVHIVIYGSDENTETGLEIRYPITSLGVITEEEKLAQICNATDVFVSPSLAESFGLTFLENILCNTPVVGFDNTAIPEIVKSGETGYLASNRDSNDLALGIDKLLSSNLVPQIEYSTREVIRRHKEIINTIFKNLSRC